MIAQAVPTAFKVSIAEGMAKDIFRMALFTVGAELNAATPGYTTRGEVVAKGYSAGGQALKGFKILRPTERTVAITWDSPVLWPDSVITARGALIYNASRGNSAVVVLDFGKDITSTDHEFEVGLSEFGVVGF